MVEPSSLSFRCFLLAAITALIVVPATALAADLSLYLKKRGPALHVRAVSAFDPSEYAIEPQAGMIQKLVQIYDLIERRPEDAGTLGKVGDFMGKQYRAVRGLIPFWKDTNEKQAVASSLPDIETLDRLLGEAGALLFDPIDTQVAIASRIEFVVTQSNDIRSQVVDDFHGRNAFVFGIDQRTLYHIAGNHIDDIFFFLLVF